MTMEGLEVKIYYEDTDCGGVVYHANYLHYFERARTEFFAMRGISIRDYMDKGITFVVVRAEIDFRAPAKYGDILLVETTVKKSQRISFIVQQSIRRKAENSVLVQGNIKLACLNKAGRLTRLPEAVLAALKG